ncbi:hypothetical protein CEXT_758311 [Caerostris extrusa]|uniref:Uncharacterized protein n=1 Tax=Caerostris extrusa TaxID=172846 RepID=A0AAV4XXM2_CAEEX|nr:hypothetical protein CEXT_758311 [Caerostris extrusa]
MNSELCLCAGETGSEPDYKHIPHTSWQACFPFKLSYPDGSMEVRLLVPQPQQPGDREGDEKGFHECCVIDEHVHFQWWRGRPSLRDTERNISK